VKSPEYLDLRHASERFDISPSTLKRWIRQGYMRGVRLGQKKLGVRVAELEQRITEFRPSTPPLSRDDLTRMGEQVFAEMWGPHWRERRRALLKQPH
jgi:transposase-like protein